MKLTERERRHIIGYLSDFSFIEDEYSDDWREGLKDEQLVRFIEFNYDGGYDQFVEDYAHYD
jgi:hypothetical protein